LVVTDAHVAPLWLAPLERSLAGAGYAVAVHVIAPGEASKTPAVLADLYAALAAAGVTRSDPVIALGGGVVGDLAGYAAATWLRGVPVIQVPTSLLAQVDSAIGGKTGLDLPQGKNLVGAFHQPALILSDPAVLSTLPDRERRNGMAEVLKTAAVLSEDLWEGLESDSLPEPEWLARCALLKLDLTGRDFRDGGDRMLLNYGHTAGHALETAGGYAGLLHGEAVSIGMVLAARIGESLGLTEPGTGDRIASLLRRHGLPDRIPAELRGREAAIRDAMALDKKRSGDRLTFILLRRIGEGFLHPVPVDAIRDRVLEAMA